MAFTIIVGALCALMVIGMPIAFAFLAVNIAGAYFFWGGVAGLNQMVLAVMDSVASFSIMPVPLFLLMGEILFRAGLAARLMDVLDAWLGRIPGRLSLMAVAGGTLFANSCRLRRRNHRAARPHPRAGHGEARLQAANDPWPGDGFRRARGDVAAICAGRHPRLHREPRGR